MSSLVVFLAVKMITYITPFEFSLAQLSSVNSRIVNRSFCPLQSGVERFKRGKNIRFCWLSVSQNVSLNLSTFVKLLSGRKLVQTFGRLGCRRQQTSDEELSATPLRCHFEHAIREGERERERADL